MTLNPKELDEVVRRHFERVTPAQFLENVRRFDSDEMAPDMAEYFEKAREAARAHREVTESDLRTRPLQAYLASALTGLGDEQRREVEHLSSIVGDVCRRHNIHLYEPIKSGTDPERYPELPATHVFAVNRRQVLSSDLLIVLANFPSFGGGEELEFARAALMPIVVIHHVNVRLSRMLIGLPAVIARVSYKTDDSLRKHLHKLLPEIEPVAAERRRLLSRYEAYSLGEHIRTRREARGLTREDIALRVPGLTAEALRQIEEEADHVANPSLIQLEQIAGALETTVEQLLGVGRNGHA